MMIKLKPTVEILDDVPYILLIPNYSGARHLFLVDVQDFLKREFGVHSMGMQTPFQFFVEESDFVVGLKRHAKDAEVCAIKILFKSFFDHDLDEKIEVLFALKHEFNLEMFDGKMHENLLLPEYKMKEYLLEIQQQKKQEMLSALAPSFLKN